MDWSHCLIKMVLIKQYIKTASCFQQKVEFGFSSKQKITVLSFKQES